MKDLKFKKIKWVLTLTTMILLGVMIQSCVASQKVASKSGAQLWAQNCQRCHNTPSPGSFSGDQWETIGMHMQTRALITEQERDKIVAFLQEAAK